MTKRGAAERIREKGPRRGLSRIESAVYLGIGPTLFDELVAAGTMPKPKRIKGAVVWDREELDIYFEAVSNDQT